MLLTSPAQPRPELVLLVEDQAEVCEWLKGIVRQTFTDAEVHTARGVHDAQRLIDHGAHYRLALIDLGLPDGSGIQLIQQLSLTQPDTQVVVTTIYGDDEHLFPALAAGAHGYLLKDQSPQALQAHLANLERGIPALSPAVARKVLEHFRRQAPRPGPSPAATDITPRETEVLALIGRGLRAHEVAQRLGLSPSTVETYVKSIYRKLSISSRAEAALEATRRGLA